MKRNQSTEESNNLKDTSVDHSIIAIPDNIRLRPEKRLLSELSWFAYSHAQVLSDVLATFQRQEIGLKLVYGLDFDVIHSFIDPWSRETGHSRIIEYYFTKDRTPFTFLPGTTEEIYDYLQYVERQQIKVKSLIKELNSQRATKETIRSVRNLCNDVGLSNSGRSFKTDLNQISLSLVEASRRYSFSLNRLRKLLHDERLISLIDIFKFKNEPVYNDDLMNSVFVELARLRKGEHKKKANLADAKNIATVIQHANQESRSIRSNPDHYSGYFLRLLTTTNCILQVNLFHLYADTVGNLKVQTLPSISERIKHSLAIRSCFEAVYSTVIVDHTNYDIHKCREIAYNFYLYTVQLSVDLSFLDGEDWNYRFGGQKDAARIARLMDHLIPRFIIDPCYQTVKYLLVQDIQEHVNKQEIFSENEKWWEPNTEEITEIGTKHLQEIEQSDLTKVELHYKEHQPRNLLKKFGITSKDIKVKKDKEFKRWIIQNEFTNPKEELFVLDYHDGVFYTSWPCIIRESQVLNIVNKLFIKSTELELKGKTSGEILLVFENGERIEKLCDLPLKNELSFKEYKEILEIIEEGCEKKNTLPSQIWCDTSIANIKFDLYIAENKISQGILFAFEKKDLFKDLFFLFKETCPWARDWYYSDSLNKLFETNVKRRLIKWVK